MNRDMTLRFRAHQDIYFYLVTSTVTDWTPVFARPATCDVLIQSLRYCQERKGLRILAYVIMPTHFHAVVAVRNSERLSGIMRDMKRYTSRALARTLRNIEEEEILHIFRKATCGGKGNTQFKVWQDEYHPVSIFTERVLKQKIDYVHSNPVRKGLVTEATEWYYSSARNYRGKESGPLE